jgi:hypothetical protein
LDETASDIEALALRLPVTPTKGNVHSAECGKSIKNTGDLDHGKRG